MAVSVSAPVVAAPLAPHEYQKVHTELARGVELARSGHQAEAEKIFRDLIRAYPRIPEPHNNLAVLYAGEGKLNQAKLELEAALNTEPSYAAAYRNLTEVYSGMASLAYHKALSAKEPKPTPLSLVYLDKPSPSDFSPAVAAMTPVPTPARETPVVVAVASPSSAGGQGEAPGRAGGASRASSEKVRETGAAEAKSQPSPSTVPAPSKTPHPTPAPSLTPVATHVASPTPTPVATNAVAPTPTPAVVSTPKPTSAPMPVEKAVGEESAVKGAVLAWAKAWETQDVSTYLGAYGRSFQPPGGKSRREWEDSRRERLKAPENIELSLENLKVRMAGEDRAEASFLQVYFSSTFKGRTRKTLVLEKENGRWVIVAERVG